MKRKFLKKEDGITLTVLIVTIIVLLILAGVSIGEFTNNDGILDRVQNTKKSVDSARVEQQVRDSAKEAYTLGQGRIDERNLKSALDNNIGDGDYELLVVENGSWKVIVEKIEFFVYDTGEVNVGNNG